MTSPPRRVLWTSAPHARSSCSVARMLCSFGRLPMVYTCLCCEMEMEVTSFRLVRIGLGGGGNWERGGIWGRGRDEGAYLEDQQRVVYRRRAARGVERFLHRDGRVEVSLHGRVHGADRASDSFRVPTDRGVDAPVSPARPRTRRARRISSRGACEGAVPSVQPRPPRASGAEPTTRRERLSYRERCRQHRVLKNKFS